MADPTPAPGVSLAPVPHGDRPLSGADILAQAAKEQETLTLQAVELVREPARRSDTLGQLALALSKAQGVMANAVRDSTNPFFKNKYASLGAVWDACREPLAQNELAIIQRVQSRGRAVVITTMLVHSSDEWIEESLTMLAAQDTPQALGGCITYGRRYGLSALVGVAVEDDDGESASRVQPEGMTVKRANTEVQRQVAAAVGPVVTNAVGAQVPPPIATTPERAVPSVSNPPPPPGPKPPARAPGA